MLKHKHFELQPGEVLYVERVDDGYDVTVRKKKDIEGHSLPCMWIFNQRWLPYAFVAKEWGCTESPNYSPGNYNLGLRWLNDGGFEKTDEVRKIQWVRKSEVVGESIVTFINCNCQPGIETQTAQTARCKLSECVTSACASRNGWHTYAHSRRHPKK